MNENLPIRYFLSNPPAWPSLHIELNDVQGLWGGRDILVSGTGEVLVQVVSRAGSAELYELTLDASQIEQLLGMFSQYDFPGLAIEERPGIPDEPRPQITLCGPAGEQHRVAKWANDSHPAFDALYQALLQLEGLATHTPPLYRGRLER